LQPKYWRRWASWPPHWGVVGQRLAYSIWLGHAWNLGLRTPSRLEVCASIQEVCHDPHMVSSILRGRRLGGGGILGGHLEPTNLNDASCKGQSRIRHHLLLALAQGHGFSRPPATGVGSVPGARSAVTRAVAGREIGAIDSLSSVDSDNETLPSPGRTAVRVGRSGQGRMR
jgi:hypothetical protein